MISPRIEKALNEQAHAEFFSFYLYLAVAAYLAAQHLDGFAAWMEAHAREELEHAMKLYHHINERGGTVHLMAIDEPQAEWASPAEALKAVYDHERFITARINELADLAASEKDHATSVLMHWYIDEQVEEEAGAETMYHQTAMVQDSPQGLLMLDRELAREAGASSTAEA